MQSEAASAQAQGVGTSSQVSRQRLKVRDRGPSRAKHGVVVGAVSSAAGLPSLSCRRLARTLSTGRRSRRAAAVAGRPFAVAIRRNASSSSDQGRAGRRTGRWSARRRAATASSERPTSRAMTRTRAPAPYMRRNWSSSLRRQCLATSGSCGPHRGDGRSERFITMKPFIHASCVNHWTPRPARYYSEHLARRIAARSAPSSAPR